MRLFKTPKIKSPEELEMDVRKQMLTAVSVKYEVSRAKVISDYTIELNKATRNQMTVLWIFVLGLVGFELFKFVDAAQLLQGIL